MAERQIGVSEGLRLDALRGIHHQQRALAGLQAPRHLVSEIDVTRSVDEIELVVIAVFGFIVEADGMRFDGDAAFALEIHRVEHLRHHLALRKRAGSIQASRSASVDFP